MIIYIYLKRNSMNTKVVLSLLLFCLVISTNALESQEIKDLAQQYAVLKKLKQNTLNAQLIIAARMRKNKPFFVDLIKKGADINAINKEGRTALINAVIAKDYQTTKILLELGASTAIKDNYGKTALDYAHEQSEHQIIKVINAFKK